MANILNTVLIGAFNLFKGLFIFISIISFLAYTFMSCPPFSIAIILTESSNNKYVLVPGLVTWLFFLGKYLIDIGKDFT